MNFEKMIVLNPGDNYKFIAEVPASTSDEIDQKIVDAHPAFRIWSEYSVQQRIIFLEKLYIAFDNRKEEIAKLIATEMGMPISIAMKIDIEVGLQYFQDYLKNAEHWLEFEIVFENQQEKHTLYFESLGIVVASTPWNYPFTNFIWAVIPNLIVGNTIVVKHSENCVLTSQLLEQIFISCNLPDNICGFVYGQGHDAGDYLINSAVDMIWFTGSIATGHHVYQVAASRDIPVLLELGGSAPGIIFEDVDIDNVIKSIFIYRFLNSGQTCDALKRLIVHHSIFNQVVEKLSNFLAQQKIGTPLDSSTQLGPLANKKQLNMIELQVEDAVSKGAKIICGGKQPQGLLGAYYQPTIITNVSRYMKVWSEEVFGPVLPIVSFTTQEEAIDLANDTIFGLGGYIYTNDKNRALEVAKKLKTGNISINGTNYVIAEDPFGAYKRSGIGREHGKLGLQELCQKKLIVINK